jgi:von Willebrand factor type A domain
MSQSTRAANGSPTSESRRWWRISEQAWYTQLVAALTLIATAFGVFFAVLQIWPDPEPSKPVKNNYAILLDRSESMGGTLDGMTKLEGAADKIRDAVGVGNSDATARGLWYFGDGCGQVDESVSLGPDTGSKLTTALEHPPPARGERSLIQALDTAVNEFANVPANLGGGDVKTVRRIVVFTDGPDECGDDLSRVTTSLDQSGIQLEFHIVGIDLAPADQQRLNDVAQSLPGFGGETAKVTPATDSLSLNHAITDPLLGLVPDETAPTPSPPTATPPRSAPLPSAPPTTTRTTTTPPTRRG